MSRPRLYSGLTIRARINSPCLTYFHYIWCMYWSSTLKFCISVQPCLSHLSLCVACRRDIKIRGGIEAVSLWLIAPFLLFISHMKQRHRLRCIIMTNPLDLVHYVIKMRTKNKPHLFSLTSGVPRNFFRGGGGSTNSVEDRGQRERGSGGGSPLVRGSGGSCNLVQEISFHIVKFS
jgi:hypothetical protein